MRANIVSLYMYTPTATKAGFRVMVCFSEAIPIIWTEQQHLNKFCTSMTVLLILTVTIISLSIRAVGGGSNQIR